MTTLPERSVKSKHIDLGAVRSEHLQISSSGGVTTGGKFATTDTANYGLVMQYTVYLPTPRVLFLAPYHLHVQHSVANARFELFVGLGNIPLTIEQTLTWLGRPNEFAALVEATAGEWRQFAGVGASQPELAFSSGGTYTLRMLIKNRTAGTLTWGHSANVDFLSHFLVGR